MDLEKFDTVWAVDYWRGYTDRDGYSAYSDFSDEFPTKEEAFEFVVNIELRKELDGEKVGVTSVHIILTPENCGDQFEKNDLFVKRFNERKQEYIEEENRKAEIAKKATATRAANQKIKDEQKRREEYEKLKKEFGNEKV